jgi:tetratricopeptide (TPR) repeat protein
LAILLAGLGSLVGLAEVGLRLAGLYVPASFLIKTADQRYFVPNQQFLRQFYSGQAAAGKILPFKASVKKPANTKRILILGESAAQGTPEPAFGFCRILQFMLKKTNPQVDIELINAALRGVDSTILAVAARDLMQLEPDVVILYIGNNEVVGLYGARGRLGLLVTGLRRSICQLAIGQFLTRILPAPGTNRQDMAYFRRQYVAFSDPRRKAVYDRLRKNLQSICTLARDAGAKVIVCTVAVNLADCPPFGSMHKHGLGQAALADWQAKYEGATRMERAGELAKAIELYQAAARIDDRLAELHYRLARCLARQGQVQEALRHYQLACDLDALAFRSDSKVNGVIRDLAKGFADGTVILADIEGRFTEDGQVIPGGQYFHDHVHLTFDGDYKIAACLLPLVQQCLALESNTNTPSLQQCAEGLAYNPFAQAQIAAGILETTSRPPFLDQVDHAQVQALKARQVKAAMDGLSQQQVQAAARLYEAALAADPNDWYIHRLYAYLALAQQDIQTALQHLRAAVTQFPDHLPTVLMYASTCVQAGLTQEAMLQYRQALRLAPGNRMAKRALRSLSRR